MKCPNCQRENEPTRRFCIFCGSILPAPEAEHGSAPAEQPTALVAEVRRLSELVALMNNRLATLEGRQGVPAPSPEETPTPGAAVTPPTATIPRQKIAAAPADRVPPGEKNRPKPRSGSGSRF